MGLLRKSEAYRDEVGRYRIGDILVQVGAMTQDQVEEVLRAQKAGDNRLFGEIAIELGYIDDNAIKRYLDFLETAGEGLDA